MPLAEVSFADVAGRAQSSYERQLPVARRRAFAPWRSRSSPGTRARAPRRPPARSGRRNIIGGVRRRPASPVCMRSPPAITAIIPTRNRSGYLADAIDTVLRQTQADLELIVIDDASTDDTQRLLATIGDGRVRVIRQRTVMGVAAARNRGIADARGAWLAFLDDDDLWAPAWLQTARTRAESERADIVYGAHIVIDGDRRPLRAALAPRADEVVGALSRINALGGPSAVMTRTSLVRDAGGFDDRLSALADWDLWLRVTDVAPAAPVPEFLVGYTAHSGNMHVARPRAVIDEFRLLARMQRARNPAAPLLDEAGFVRWVADDTRRSGRRRQAALVYAEAALRGPSVMHLARGGACMVRRDGRPRRAAPPWTGPDWLARYER
jgi:hypothetical protein